MDRQVIELAQNSADALLQAERGDRRISIRLAGDRLYCADDGLPIDEDGITALMFARLSSKRDTAAIGRFGLGFKSVLGVTDTPEFYSRSASFRFDPEHSRTAIKAATGRELRGYPVLRLPESLDPCRAKLEDDTLGELMSWATNIVRLPLLRRGAEALAQQIRDFPAEFLLLVHHVRELHLDDGKSVRRYTLRQQPDEEFELLQMDVSRGTEQASRWRIFQTTHTLSRNARDDRRSLDDGNEVPITWAAPLDAGRDVGHFWAYFPTRTASLVDGILNAPWKTNEDRQNLLPGPYNDEIIRAAARLVADHLHELSTEADPSRHLDALPRRHEAGDSGHAELLRTKLFELLSERRILPDQNGELHEVEDLRYPPSELTRHSVIDLAPFECWRSYERGPKDWLHHSALSRGRLSRIDRIFGAAPDHTTAPRAPIAEWLEALVDGQQGPETVGSSKAAIQTAAAIPPLVRGSASLGDIVLTVGGDWSAPDPDVLFLPDESLGPDLAGAAGPSTDADESPEASFVHAEVTADPATRRALKELGLRQPSPESQFRRAAKRAGLGKGTTTLTTVLGLLPVTSAHESVRRAIIEVFGEEDANATMPVLQSAAEYNVDLWKASRELSVTEVIGILMEFVPKPFAGHEVSWLRSALPMRTLAGTWRALATVLLPGPIVPDGGSRDDGATIDIGFHHADRELLRELGATDGPTGGLDIRCTECRYGRGRAP